MQPITEEKILTCALNRIFNFEPQTANRLIELYGGAKGVFAADKKELGDKFRIKEKHIRQITKKEADSAFKELLLLEKSGAVFIGINEKNYPKLLKECFDAPTGIYFKSSEPPEKVFTSKQYIAVVGSRNMSSYGKEWCGRIMEVLGRSGKTPAIVSGLAIGIDGEAHRSAIKNKLPTIAVMATGINKIYPERHRELASLIESSPESALVTDFPPGTPPVPVNFIRRNRIIAGLCQTALLIESKVKGGGMITARLAFSYNRDVYALPGRADDPLSSGCNKLIEERAAELIFSPGNLAGKLGLKPVKEERKRLAEDMILEGECFGNMGKEEKRVLAQIAGAIRRTRDISVEDIRLITGLAYSDTLSMITLLESESIINVDILQRCSLCPGVG